MRHSNSGRKFSRTSAHRKAMFRNMAKSLIMLGRIRTTEMKAKDLRRVVEPLITLAKRNDLHSRRLAYKELNDHAIVKHLFDKIGPIFAEVPGGYTRVLKLAKNRRGDNAPMAIIEFSRSAAGEQKKPKPAGKASARTSTPEAGKPEQQTVKQEAGASAAQEAQNSAPADAKPEAQPEATADASKAE